MSTVYQALCECRKWCGLSSGHFLPHPIVFYFSLWWQRLMHIVSLFLWLSGAEEGQRLEPEASYVPGANVFF